MDINNLLVLGAKSNAPKNKPIDASKVTPTLFNTKRKFKGPSDNFLKWLTRTLAVAGISLAMFLGMTFMNVGKVSLPTTDQVYQNLNTVGVGTEIVTKMDNGQITRFITEQGKPIKVGVSDQFSAEEKQVIQECLEKYNEVFKEINPNYQFVIDEDTSLLEKLDSNYIQVAPIGALEGNTVAYESSGAIPTINGFDTAYNKVFMGEASRENLNMFRNTFLHEFMHALGVADAYLVPGFYEGTIMNCTSSSTKTNDIYKYDVAQLAALYGDFSSQEKVDKLINFINNYGANSTYTDTSHCKYRKTPVSSNINKVDENEEGQTF